MAGLEDRWPEIKKRSKSEDEFDRTIALANAVGCLERALTVSGVSADKRRGIAPRLREYLTHKNNRHIPQHEAIFSAIDARNAAIHEHKVPSLADTRDHVSTLHKVWRVMRRKYVSRNNAIRLARTCLDFEGISNVFLYGSLAHGKSDPKDIDLILFDNGEYSYYGLGYQSESLFEAEDIAETEADLAAIRCGWLQYVFIDGTRFGRNREYTLNLAKNQRDPLFLLNVADGLLQYDPATKRFTAELPQEFQRLAYLRRQLETENILASQKSQK